MFMLYQSFLEFLKASHPWTLSHNREKKFAKIPAIPAFGCLWGRNPQFKKYWRVEKVLKAHMTFCPSSAQPFCPEEGGMFHYLFFGILISLSVTQFSFLLSYHSTYFVVVIVYIVLLVLLISFFYRHIQIFYVSLRSSLNASTEAFLTECTIFH